MPAVTHRHANVPGLTKHGIEAQLGPFVGTLACPGALPRSLLIPLQVIDALDDIELESSLCAGHGHAQPLPGSVGDEVVGEQCAAPIPYRHVHGVFDSDSVAKDVAVAQVAGFGLGV